MNKLSNAPCIPAMPLFNAVQNIYFTDQLYGKALNYVHVWVESISPYMGQTPV